MEPGGIVTKGTDKKTWLDQRQARIAAATGKPDEGQQEETEQERLEQEADELTSQLKEAERAEDQAWEKRTMGQSKMLQPMDHRWTISKATESSDTSGGQKEEKVDEDGGHCER